MTPTLKSYYLDKISVAFNFTVSRAALEMDAAGVGKDIVVRLRYLLAGREFLSVERQELTRDPPVLHVVYPTVFNVMLWRMAGWKRLGPESGRIRMWLHRKVKVEIVVPVRQITEKHLHLCPNHPSVSDSPSDRACCTSFLIGGAGMTRWHASSDEIQALREMADYVIRNPHGINRDPRLDQLAMEYFRLRNEYQASALRAGMKSREEGESCR